MIKPEQITKLKELIESHDNIAVFHHVNPDGDCMATSFGLSIALREAYPNKNIKVVADIEDYTPHLRYMDKHIDWEYTMTEPEHDDYLFIIGDTSVGSRVRFFDRFEGKSNAIFCYDHHENALTVDNVDLFWSEPDYPAAAIMAYEIVEGLGIELSAKAALVINHGILTDTGFYRFSPGQTKPFEASAKMNAIIGETIQKDLYKSMGMRSRNEINFQGWVLGNYKVAGDKVAYMVVTKEDIDRFGFKPDEAARVGLLHSIEGIDIWMFFIQYPDFVRVEFRSHDYWVNEIATEFGGGGHKSASGCHLDNMEDHIKVVDRALEIVNKD